MSKRIVKRTCIFCGVTRDVVIRDSHEPDEDGRSYGIYEIDTDEGCKCSLGQASFNKVKINPMCMNCTYNIGGMCTNQKTKEEITSQFAIPELKIKNNTKKCKNWKVSETLISNFV